MHGFIKEISKVLECYSYLENASKMCDAILRNQQKKKHKDYTIYNDWAKHYNENLNLMKELISHLDNYMCVCNEKIEIKTEV